MRVHALPSAFLLAFLLTPLSSAIYQDEAYKIDYQHALLGTPKRENTFFHRPSATSKASLLYTLSEKNVLGAVNPKDGAIVWRQLLADPTGTSKGLLKAGGNQSTVVTAVGNEVRAWDAADGRLVWSWLDTGRIQDLEVLDREKSKDVIVLSVDQGKSSITKLASLTGKKAWQISAESGDKPIAIASCSSNLYYISLHSALLKGFKIKVTRIDLATGKENSHAVLNSENEVSSEDEILHIGSNSAAAVVVWTDKSFKTVKINVLGSKHITSINVLDHGDEIVEIIVHAPNTATSEPHILIHYQASNSHWAEVYHINRSNGSAKKAYDLSKLGGRGSFSSSIVDTKVYFTRNTASEVSMTSSALGGVLERWPIQSKSHGGLLAVEGVVHSVSEVVPKGASNFAIRSAVTLVSGDWELIRNGDLVWLRSESLAGVVAAAWAEIPHEEELAKELAAEIHDNVLAAYIHRVKRHLRDLGYLPNWIQHLPGRILRSFVGDKALDPAVNEAAFGFRKIVIVATAKGRVMALDTGHQGAVIWNIQAMSIPAGSTWNVTAIVIEDDTALILAAKGQTTRIETMTGTIRSPPSFGDTTNLETLIPLGEGSDRRILVPVLSDGTPGLVPGTLGNATTIVTRRPGGSVAGWSLAAGQTAVLAWEFIPSAGERIATVTTRPPHDPVASIGKVLGDRNVLYKYLSPNLVLITTTNAVTSTVSVYLLDSISGQTYYSTTHTGVDVTKPIPTTFSEHWFAYSIYTDPVLSPAADKPFPKAYQLIITELYESHLVNDRGPLGNSTSFSSLSSHLSPPHVISQAYVIPAPVGCLTTTSTLQGITPRSLLALSPQLSAILAIPIAVLSARRPVGRDPTAFELEEGLGKYGPLLEFNPAWTLSHKRELLGIKGITTAPTKMESTSLVFAYGDVDVFGSRISPIGAFDVLGTGFSKIQLIGTVLALGIGTGVLAPLVRKRQIDGLWKI